MRGVVSLIVRLADGRCVEASAVGLEGMAGISAFLANAVSPVHAVVQVAGTALRLSSARLRREAVPGKKFRTLLERYALALFATSSQSVACIRFHHVVERCARWLLTTHDSVPEGTFELTHEYLATMLGVRRAGVSEAVGALSSQGLIHSERGHVAILDRPGLEAAVCECYRVIRQEFDTVYR
jgi:CRP-like cAMP-binding protein